MENKKYVIWSDMNLLDDDRVQDTKEMLMETLEEDEITEETIMQAIFDDSELSFDDEVGNLRHAKEAEGEIVAIASLGRWNGRKSGYRLLGSMNLSACMTGVMRYDFNEWFVDEKGDLRSTHIHHDGTNTILYRSFKKGLTYEQVDTFLKAIYNDELEDGMIDEYTESVGVAVADLYGWEVGK